MATTYLLSNSCCLMSKYGKGIEHVSLMDICFEEIGNFLCNKDDFWLKNKKWWFYKRKKIRGKSKDLVAKKKPDRKHVKQRSRIEFFSDVHKIPTSKLNYKTTISIYFFSFLNFNPFRRALLTKLIYTAPKASRKTDFGSFNCT